MSVLDHFHAVDCASRNIDDLFRGPCDCYADDWCGDPDCPKCGDAPEDDEAVRPPEGERS